MLQYKNHTFFGQRENNNNDNDNAAAAAATILLAITSTGVSCSNTHNQRILCYFLGWQKYSRLGIQIAQLFPRKEEVNDSEVGWMTCSRLNWISMLTWAKKYELCRDRRMLCLGVHSEARLGGLNTSAFWMAAI